MLDSFLSYVFSQPVRAVLPVCLVLLIAATELSYHCGLRLHHRRTKPAKGRSAASRRRSLGCSALLLGFTFALAVQRYETRRTLVVEEANAIGTDLPARRVAAARRIRRLLKTLLSRVRRDAARLLRRWAKIPRRS